MIILLNGYIIILRNMANPSLIFGVVNPEQLSQMLNVDHTKP